jgi:hypothetical protein
MLSLDDRPEQLFRSGMRVLACLVACAAAFTPRTHGQCSFTASSVDKLLTYVFDPIVADGKLILRVTLEFRVGGDGTTELELPSKWAGQSHLEAEVTNLRTISGDVVILDTVHPLPGQFRESTSVYSRTYPGVVAR